jgi:hypothetical protein
MQALRKAAAAEEEHAGKVQTERVEAAARALRVEQQRITAQINSGGTAECTADEALQEYCRGVCRVASRSGKAATAKMHCSEMAALHTQGHCLLLGYHNGKNTKMALWLTALTEILGGDSNEGNIAACLQMVSELLDCIPAEDQEGKTEAVSMTLNRGLEGSLVADGGLARSRESRGQLLQGGSSGTTNPLPRTAVAVKAHLPKKTQTGTRQDLVLPSKSLPPPTSASSSLMIVNLHAKTSTVQAPPPTLSKFQFGTRSTAPLPCLRFTTCSSPLDSGVGGLGPLHNGDKQMSKRDLGFLSRYLT